MFPDSLTIGLRDVVQVDVEPLGEVAFRLAEGAIVTLLLGVTIVLLEVSSRLDILIILLATPINLPGGTRIRIVATSIMPDLRVGAVGAPPPRAANAPTLQEDLAV